MSIRRAPAGPPDIPAPVLERAMVVVTGKGGVGKTTVAAALALAAVARGRATVVCEVGGQTRLPRLFGRRPPAPGAMCDLGAGLASVSIDPGVALAEWTARTAGRPAAALLARSQTFAYFFAAAPGARELVTIGKARDLAAGGTLVILDAPSSGHAVALLQAPRTFAAVTSIGPVGRQAAEVRDDLGDPAITAVVLVCTPADMPVSETLWLDAAIAQATGRGADVVVADQVAPDRFTADEVARIERALRRSGDPALQAARRQARRAREQRRELRRLRAALGLPVAELPFLFGPAIGRGECEALAGVLGAALDASATPFGRTLMRPPRGRPILPGA
ncbi:MAG: ArsA-related P-loop ATPase [Solirubrobacteraceae bacterium]